MGAPSHARFRVYDRTPIVSRSVLSANYLRFKWSAGGTTHPAPDGDSTLLFTKEEKERPGFAFVVLSMPDRSFLKPRAMDDLLDIVDLAVTVKGASIIWPRRCLRGRRRFLVKSKCGVAPSSARAPAQPIPKSRPGALLEMLKICFRESCPDRQLPPRRPCPRMCRPGREAPLFLSVDQSSSTSAPRRGGGP